MKTLAQVEIEIDSKLSKADAKKAKEAATAIKKEVKDGNSALECMDRDTHNIRQLMTYKSDCKKLKRDWTEMRRISPLKLHVSIRNGSPLIQASWHSQGMIDGKPCIAFISMEALWIEDDYSYMWLGDSQYTAYAIVYLMEIIK